MPDKNQKDCRGHNPGLLSRFFRGPLAMPAAVVMERCLGRMFSPFLPKTPQTARFRFEKQGLAEPFRIVHLSDLHAGSWLPREYPHNIARMTLEAEPDLVVWTGDFYHTSLPALDQAMKAFHDLHRQVPSFAVLGNHDIDPHEEPLTSIIKASGLTLLKNEEKVIKVRGNEVAIAGVDDAYMGDPELSPTFIQRDADFKLLLTHQPAYVFQIPPATIDLALAGHLHGGQVNFPILGPLYLPSYRGKDFISYPFVEVAGNQIHTSQGLGYTMIPWRWRCPPQIHILDIST